MTFFEKNPEDKSQTVRMDLRLLFDHIDRVGPREIIVTNIKLEDAGYRVNKERKRRAHKDRAHRFEIRYHWTDLGMLPENEDSRERNPHIDGEWKPFFRKSWK
jgi:hypothetical protein